MSGRLGKRVVQFANLPIKLLMPSSFTNIREIALKTIPSASKIEIKRVLESLYGFEVEKVQTLNRDGKKKKIGGLLIAKADYKKAYVTLKNPLSIDPNLYPIRIIQEDKERMNKQSKSSLVEEAPSKKHWLDHKKEEEALRSKGYHKPYHGANRDYMRETQRSRPRNGSNRDRAENGAGTAKFPWTSMRSGRGGATR